MKSTLSYPNFSEFTNISPQRDVSKWMTFMRDIYIRTHLGENKTAATNYVTKELDMVEKRQFIDWMKYYESGDFLKYKTAQNQSYYVNDDLNYFLPNPQNKHLIPSPLKSINDQIATLPKEVDHANVNSSKEEKRKIVEDQRRKLLGRLNAVEKILSSHHGQIFAGSEFEKLLNSIYDLKKQIQTVNKMSLSSQTCVDLIVRQANILSVQGFTQASGFMIKLAQNTPGDFSFNLGDTPAGGSAPQGAGSLGNNTPDLIDTQNINPNGGKAISEFMENLEGSGITDFKEDEAKADDEIDMDDDILLDQEIVPEDNELVVEAQLAQEPSPIVPAAKEAVKPSPVAPEKPIRTKNEVEGLDGVKTKPIENKTDLDAIIDTAFANITIEDIVGKLEEVAFILKNREVVRKLSVIDMALQSKEIAQFFPTLGEIVAKQLDSNNYGISRIDDIISRLSGSGNSRDTGLETSDKEVKPENKQLKDNLQRAEQQEKKRKEMRKNLQDQELQEETKPEETIDNVQQELTEQPAAIEKTPAKLPTPAPTLPQ